MACGRSDALVGVMGFAVGEPLHALAATWASSLVLITIGLVGLVVLTKTSVRVAADRTAAGVRPLTKMFTGLFELGSNHETVASITGLYDQDADAATAVDRHDEEPPRPKRPPKLKVMAPTPIEDDGPTEQLAIDLGPGAKPSPWKLPPLSALERAETQEVDKRAVEERGRVLEAALAQHGVETRLVGMVVGPSVTRYELELAPGVKVARLTSLHKDIAYAMASPDVRILAPIPGRQAIGVEVPNAERQIVSLGDILASPEAKRAQHPLEVAVGRDINGKAVMMNLATMPHLLIAGATGAGQVELPQLDHHVDAHALDARSTAHDPRRPEARRDGSVRPPPAPAHASGHEPEEGGQRAVVGRAARWSGATTCWPGRLSRHHRLQRGLRSRRAGSRAGQ